MLSMDDIKYIKRLYEREGVSIREIMRRTGYRYETVRKYLDMEDFNEPSYPPRNSVSLLDPLKPVIDQWLTDDLKAPRKQRHTAKRIYQRLQEEYPDQLEVKLRTVQYYVSSKKKELYQSQQKARLPLYDPPGEAQVDFGHFSYINNSGDMVEGRRGRRRALRFHLLVSFLPENSLPVKELFIGDAIGFAPCGFWHTTCKTFIDDSCPLFTVYFVCDFIHNITSWGYYLIGERLCHGTHGLPCTKLYKTLALF